MKSIDIWHRVTQISFFSLLSLLCVWFLVLFPPTFIPSWLALLLMAFPLACATPGVLKKKLYTYAWAQFINMIYFCHAIMVLMSSTEERLIAAIELFLVLVFFTAAVVTIRLAKSAANSESPAS